MLEVTHNPLNIRFSRFNYWSGQIAPYKGFCCFKSEDLGYRAAIILLRNYIIKRNLTTPYQIIHRFAPDSENDTVRYLDYIRVNRKIDIYKPVADYESLFKLISAMAYYETHSRVSVDTLRMISIHYGLFVNSPLLMRYAEPIQGV